MSRDPGVFTRAREQLEQLVEAPDAERAERLAALALEDPALARLVEELLRADARGDGFLERPAAELAREAAGDGMADEIESIPDSIGEVVGPYRLIALLGRGGMGEVYLADRTDGQFEQQVALKLLKRGMDSDEILRRFLRERQILARLDHPNIARLLDGGVAPDHRPYFVLERVVGSTITEYCATRGLGVDERLRLVITCCDAVAAAHRRLVVHRDLKPSNILVTDDGQVKLLDFGIAKLLDEDGGETKLTGAALRMLTPAYAAPEQILGGPVTTATDVYAIGVVLFELLTGRLPHDRHAPSVVDLAIRVSQETVDGPSSVVRSSMTGMARDRQRLARRLAGDLDTVLLKALHREPERRYASAAAFADDLRRHLVGHPVAAQRDTLWYRARKMAGRHVFGVAATALILISMIAGLAGTIWQARLAGNNARAAQANARRAELVKEFLVGLFEVADPEQSGGVTVSARDLVEQGGRRLETELAGEPETQADLLETVARINRSLGLLDPAVTLAQRSLDLRRRLLPSGDAAIGRSLAALGAARMSQGKLDEAEKRLGEAIVVLQASEQPGSLALARARSDYAQVLFWKGDLAGAGKLEREVYETIRMVLGEEHVETAAHLRNLGVLLEDMDRLDEAEQAYRSSQAVLERRLGADHVTLAQSYLNYAVLLDRQGRVSEAESLYMRSLEVRRNRLGSAHPGTGQSLQLIALFFLNQGRLEEAEAHYREALTLFRHIDPEHFEVGKCLNGLGLIASRRGDYAAAELTLRDVVALFHKVLGVEHPFYWQAKGNLARQIALQGRLDDALATQREVLERIEVLTGSDSAETAEARDRLAETLRLIQKQGRGTAPAASQSGPRRPEHGVRD